MARLLALILAAAALAEEPAMPLLERLGSSDPTVRVEAMEEARRLAPEARAALAERVATQRPDVAMRIWRIAGDDARSTPEMVSIALRAAGPDGRRVWGVAARTIGEERFLREEPPCTADVLVQLLSAADSNETRAVGAPDREAPQRLHDVLALARHPVPQVRAALAEWLGAISGRPAREALEALCTDPAGCVRLAAMRALVPRFAERRDVREFLSPFLSDSSPEVRIDAVRQLASCAGPSSDFAAWMRLYDPDLRVRDAAAGYFVARHTSWALPYLLRGATTPETMASVEEWALLVGERPRAAMELAWHLSALPRAAMPSALHVLSLLAAQWRLPGPAWVPPKAARIASLPATVSWAEGNEGTALRVFAASALDVRVRSSVDGVTWRDVGLFHLAAGERVIPLCVGTRQAHVEAAGPSAGPPGAAAELTPSATACPLVGPPDPVEAWKTWAADADTLLTGEAEKAISAARSRMDHSDAAGAGEVLDAYLAKDPSHAVARLWKAQTLVDRSSVDEARELLERLVADRPAYAPALALLARVCEVKEDPSAARGWWGKAISADPSVASYRSSRAKLEVSAEDHAAAAEDLEAAVTLQPEDATLRFDYGYELLQAGRYAEGVEEFRRVVDRDPSSLDARYNIACGLARQGDLEGALQALQGAVDAGFHDGDWARKDPDLESIRSDPRFEGILNARGGE